MTTKTKKSFEKLYLVLDDEGYGIEEFSQSRDAFRSARKLEKDDGKKFYVAQLVVVEDPSAEKGKPKDKKLSVPALADFEKLLTEES